MRKNYDLSAGDEVQIFVCPEMSSCCILTCLYIFSINVLKLVLNLVSQRFAKDLKDLFVCQSNHHSEKESITVTEEQHCNLCISIRQTHLDLSHLAHCS